jgi:hypothetical protein
MYLPTIKAATEDDTLNCDSMYLGRNVELPLINIPKNKLFMNSFILFKRQFLQTIYYEDSGHYRLDGEY